MSLLWNTLSGIFNGTDRARKKAFRQLQNGHPVEAASSCVRLLGKYPNDPLALSVLADVAALIGSAVERYRQTSDKNSADALRKIRLDFVSMYRSLPADSIIAVESASLASAHSLLMESGLRELERNAQEEYIFGELRTEWLSAGSVISVPNMASIMLLGFGFEFADPAPFKVIPECMREKYCQYLLESPQVFQRLGDADAYGHHLHKAMEMIHCECLFEHSINPTDEARKLVHIAALRMNFVQAYFTPQNLKRLMKLRGDLIAAVLIFAGAPILRACVPAKRSDGKIKLGIFTSSLGMHTDAQFTIAHFDHLDRTRFHVTLYVLTACGGPLERHCIARVDQFIVLPADDVHKQAERIRADDLDLLLFGLNLSTITREATLLGGMRLARSQIASVCSPVTTGLRHMDVVLSAEENEPAPDADKHYSEMLWRMPGSINVYAYQYDTEPATIDFSRSSLQITGDTIVFFSGANFFKIIPELSLSWAKILERVPNSVLVLMPFNPNWTSHYQRLPFVTRIKQQFSELGVDTARLHFVEPVASRADVHKVLSIADIYLDAYPFSGACSMLDPIIVGIPPVVRSGNVGRSIHGAALMRMAGTEELICTSEESYINTASDLATQPARRVRIRETFERLNAAQPQPYLDTRNFSARVGAALVGIHSQYLERIRAFEVEDEAGRIRKLNALADSLLGKNIEIAAISDIATLHCLIKPYFHSKQRDRPLHMIDVGACFGHMADPLLADGWTADLFEPDPGPRPHLERGVAKYGSRCRVFATAISNSPVGEVEFHQSQNGLSGLGESPFKSTKAILKVPCTRLADFYVKHQVNFVDFLKIDAEGYDFDVLETHDFSVMRPSLVMVEYGTHFERESLAVLNHAIARMSAAGYGSVLLNYDDDGHFKKGNFIYRLTQILLDQPMPDLGRAAIGNVLFYLKGDSDFLLTLYALLDSCRPRASA